MAEIVSPAALSAADTRTSGEPSAASPPTRRVVQTIELLSRHPAEHLSLAQIVRGTGMSRATAHAVLTQLTADGWTIRDGDGNYCLGLGLMTVARRAEAAFPLRRLAAEAIQRLADAHRIPAFLAEREGDSIVITEVIGTPSVPWMRAGRHIPFVPPVCREFVAWAPAATREHWLAAAEPIHRPRLELVLDAIRTRGYSVERLADDSAPMLEALTALRHSPVTDPLRHRLSAMITELITIDYLPDELGEHNAVVSVAAPIFGADGEVVASIVACPDTQLPAARLVELAEATVAAASVVGAAVHR
ncbi:helix-turn-helix domain-containing protein [Nocardia sp. NBC_01503]|uniref:IclR family transcriptional regulator n=1 Tax=Nocardia sp. NBC_01503 TaxID=2975997 RepID=UPI002E7B2D03|nr:helix-turn-helix domain-containing protein [Nocardia sp. NBC_01503]WTL32616.1 helix-turn-helix domain-containing protein [Nocardia sp. NBC_01503]